MTNFFRDCKVLGMEIANASPSNFPFLLQFLDGGPSFRYVFDRFGPVNLVQVDAVYLKTFE